MTDFELLYSLNVWVSATFSVFSVYITIVTTFIVASYLVAHKLGRPMAGIMIAIFTLAFLTCLQMETDVAVFIPPLSAQMMQRAHAASSAFAFMADKAGPPIAPRIWQTLGIPLMKLAPVTYSLAYIGALAFFFYQRKVGKQAD